MFYNLWAGFGSLLIYFISAFTRIPEEILESAQLEGVGIWQKTLDSRICKIYKTVCLCKEKIELMGRITSNRSSIQLRKKMP